MGYARQLSLDLPRGQSAFLWGARQTGKTTLLRERFPESAFFDLLRTDVSLRFTSQPSRLAEELAAMAPDILRRPVIIDEIQKVPGLLDEVHRLIEAQRLSFILCGSSARKLRRAGTNLLGGRAWRFDLYPLTRREVDDFDLIQALNQGLIPAIYNQPGWQRSLRAYVEDYLTQEIFNEGLTRNVPAFSRFFEALRFSHGELLNYSAIARDCGVDAKTVKEYFQILVDTLVGHIVQPFSKRSGRQSISKAPKFYLFDVGVASHVCRRTIDEPVGEQFGRAFEHFVLMELIAYRSYQEKDFPINFWRTRQGMEVDFVLGGGEVAVEVKGRVRQGDQRPMKAFIEEFRPRRTFIVTNEPAARMIDGIHVLPWDEFFTALYEGDVI